MYQTLLILIPALPLAAAVFVACFGRMLKERCHWPVIAALAGSLFMSLVLLKEVDYFIFDAGRTEHVGVEKTVTLWRWADVPNALPVYSEPGSPASRVESSPRSDRLNEATQQRPVTAALDWLANHQDRTVQDANNLGARDFSISVTLRADPLTAIMLAMVTFISLLVAIYSVGYMHGDRGYWRFFSYIGLFVFSMTMLVSVSNFVLLYVFWEAVGLCSYLLVGFWYEKPAAVAAGKKAFLVNRIGDFGFVIGLFLIWTTYGTLDFHDTMGTDAHGNSVVQTAGVLGQTRLAMPDGAGYVGGAVGTAICLLLMAGACGKSAQFPLHVWLPDAMEGPTPVSALIHAATMVTAGVYMVTRCTPLFHAAPQAQHVVALIGCFTALMAGLIALTQNDLKRVLAYSTVSQLGYMFLSIGVGSVAGIFFGMFHLFTHAFFKALLFLGAGSVMHAMGGVVDMRRFSGLRKIMPTTCWTFLFGCLALAGVVPFAGFWSKDGILATLYQRGAEAGTAPVLGIAWLGEGTFYQILYWTGAFTALLTAFYTFRAFFRTFFGPLKIPVEAGHHAHESPRSMTVPLMILAVCALVVGGLMGKFYDFLVLTPSLAGQWLPRGEESEPIRNLVMVTSTVIALAGIGFAAFLYLGEDAQADWLARALRPFYWLSYGKFFFDPIYDWLVVRPMAALAAVCYWVDRNLIDGLVDLLGAIPAIFGSGLRSLQNGVVQFYALAMILGLLALIGTLINWHPG